MRSPSLSKALVLSTSLDFSNPIKLTTFPTKTCPVMRKTNKKNPNKLKRKNLLSLLLPQLKLWLLLNRNLNRLPKNHKLLLLKNQLPNLLLNLLKKQQSPNKMMMRILKMMMKNSIRILKTTKISKMMRISTMISKTKTMSRRRNKNQLKNPKFKANLRAKIKESLKPKDKTRNPKLTITAIKAANNRAARTGKIKARKVATTGRTITETSKAATRTGRTKASKAAITTGRTITTKAASPSTKEENLSTNIEVISLFKYSIHTYLMHPL